MNKRSLWFLILSFVAVGLGVAGCGWFRGETRPAPTKRLLLPSARLVRISPLISGPRWTCAGWAGSGRQSRGSLLAASVR
jgi:hypothetical protein